MKPSVFKATPLLLLLAVFVLLLMSCDKGNSTVTPVGPVVPATVKSSFDINFNGKTYTVVDTAGVVSAMTSTTGSSDGAVVLANNSTVNLSFSSTKTTSIGTSVGTYRSGCGASRLWGLLDLYDKGDGNKHYTSDCTGADTTSTINIAVSTLSQVQGTFSITLTFGGNYYPATGHFNYKK